MHSRRTFLGGAGALLASTTLSEARDLCAVYNKDTQAAMTPEQALANLKAGNVRFTSGKPLRCDLRAQVKATAQGQYPFASVLGCMDSRVPPELVFDQHIGDIFVVRVAGNVVDIDVLGSLEYATKVVGTKLVVVLGHSQCGAVKGAIEQLELGNLSALLNNIRPACLEVTGVEGPRDVKNSRFVEAVVERNARDSVNALTTHSQLMADLVAEKKLLIVPAVHDISTGVVSWLV